MKPWYLSKTIWVGIAEIIAGVSLGVVEKEIVGAIGITMAICGAIQSILRLVTGTEVTITKK